MSRDLALSLEDIAASCAKIQRFVANKTAAEVFENELFRDAVLFNLQILGEAAKRVPSDFREQHPEIPWRQIAGMRDVIAHAYFALDVEILWSAIRDEVPALRRQIGHILEKL